MSEPNSTGPLTKYLIKAIKESGFLFSQYVFNENARYKNVDLYWIHAAKVYGDAANEYFLIFDENKKGRLSKDRHYLHIYLVCRFDNQEESDAFAEEIKWLNIPKENYAQMFGSELKFSVTFRQRVPIKDIRNFSEELIQTEKYFLDTGVAQLYWKYKKQRTNKA